MSNRCSECGWDWSIGHSSMCSASADHGISPVQPSERAQQMLVHATVAARGEANHHHWLELREKVEALEKNLVDACRCVSFLDDERKSQDERLDDVETRLDAALKRIEELERVVVDCITRIEELERR